MPEITRKQFIGSAAAVMLGAAFGLDLTPTESAALAETIVPEAPDVPTFVIRGTKDGPLVSLEGELSALTIGLDQPTHDVVGNGVVLGRYAAGLPILTLTCQCPFAVRDERES